MAHRIALVERPYLIPGHCFICGGNAGEMIDTGVEVPGDGRFYICTRICLPLVARCGGYVHCTEDYAFVGREPNPHVRPEADPRSPLYVIPEPSDDLKVPAYDEPESSDDLEPVWLPDSIDDPEPEPIVPDPEPAEFSTEEPVPWFKRSEFAEMFAAGDAEELIGN